MIELLMAEYRLTLFEAVFRFPIRAAFALIPSRSERLGRRQSGPTDGDTASIRKRAQVKEWLKAHFTIVPEIKTPSRKNG